MSKLLSLAIAIPFLILVITFSKPAQASHIPVCATDTQGRLLDTAHQLHPNDVDPRLKTCPSETFCYRNVGEQQPFECYAQKTQPVISTPVITQPPPTVTGTGSILVSPNPAPIDIDVNFDVAGKGLGTYLYILVPQGAANAMSTVNFTISASGCRINSRTNDFYADNTTCTILDNTQQTWSLILRRRPFQINGDFEAKLTNASTGNGYIAITPFTIGTSTQTLNVVVSPPGPLKNDQNNTVTLTWSPVTTGSNYLIDTNLPTLLNFRVQTCNSSPNCTRTVTIPEGAPGGGITFTVTQDGNSANKGSATVQIESVIAPNLTLAQSQSNACTKEDIDAGKCTSATAVKCPSGDGILTAFGCIPTTPADFVKALLKFAIGIAGGIAFLLMIMGAFQMITSAGNPETLKAGQERFTSAIIGLLFVIFSVLLLKIIGVDLLNFSQFFGG